MDGYTMGLYGLHAGVMASRWALIALCLELMNDIHVTLSPRPFSQSCHKYIM